MPKKVIVDAINAQISMEMNAAHTYLSMSVYLAGQDLPGFARWMRVQHQEEVAHAMRLFDYLLDVGGVPEVPAVKRPLKTWKSPKAVMEESLKQEKSVTKAINSLYALSLKEKDYPTQLQLQWFINEQVEEERTFSDIIAKMEMAGDSGQALLLMDRELGARSSG
jgi:ferritin